MKPLSIAGVLALVLVAAACATAKPIAARAGDIVAAASASSAREQDHASQSLDCPTEGEELETAKLYIEHNATDADTGVHGLFGGEAWSELCIWDPTGTLILAVHPQGPLGDLRIADLFFESREPPNDEYSLADLMVDFPEGVYLVGGTDFEGVPRVGTATFSHAIASEPEILSPRLAEDAESAATAPIDRRGIVVRWAPVTESMTGDDVSITGYEVIVTKVEHEDPNGLSRPIYDVHVGPEATWLSVPDEFVEPATLYELEVLALEESGNQTIALGFFSTRGARRG